MIDLGWMGLVLPLIARVGLRVGLSGVGGGTLMTTLLITTYGLYPPDAVGTDLPRSLRVPAAGATIWPTMSIGRSCSGSRREACPPLRRCSGSLPCFPKTAPMCSRIGSGWASSSRCL